MSPRIILICPVLAVLATAPAARAHILQEGGKLIPVIELKITVGDEQVVHDTHIPLKLYLPRVLGVTTIEDFEAIDEKRRAALAADYFHSNCPLRIDGVPVRPIVESSALQLPEAGTLPDDADVTPVDVGAIVLRLRYEAKGAPHRISMVWGLYDPDGPKFLSYGSETVVAELHAGGKARLEVFTRTEPEVIWHSPDAFAAPTDMTVKEAPAPDPITLPLLAILLISGGLLQLALRRSRPLSRRIAWVTGLAAVGVASTFTELGWNSIELPGHGRLIRPGDAAAVAIFESLHRNIYRAFDYTRESAIYDTLAESVDGPRLEAIYGDIYRSLIMREDGGAVCKIQSVDIIEAAVTAAHEELAEEPEGFRVRCRWRVHGLVRHWGHTHQRTREFTAIFGVAPRGGVWKIVHTGVLRQERIPPAQKSDSGPAAGSPGK